jgi:hypothetical protein
MSTDPLGDAIADIQTKILAITVVKINSAPTNPTESLNGDFPFAVTYPSDIDYDFKMGGIGRGDDNITTQIHWTRQSLPTAVAAARPVARAFMKALFNDPTLSRTVVAIKHIHGKFGFLEWGDKEATHIGWDFTITVAIREVASL